MTRDVVLQSPKFRRPTGDARLYRLEVVVLVDELKAFPEHHDVVRLELQRQQKVCAGFYRRRPRFSGDGKRDCGCDRVGWSAAIRDGARQPEEKGRK